MNLFFLFQTILKHFWPNSWLYSWTIQEEKVVQFWIQYHESGRWVFCKRWPDFCKTDTATPVNEMPTELYQTEDVFSEMLIGPVLVTYTYTGIFESEDSTQISDVWFIAQSLDIIVASGKCCLFDKEEI